MKRLYKLRHEFDDENTCLAIVANSAKDAMIKGSGNFDYVEGDLSRKDFVFGQRVKRLKQFDVKDLPLGYLDSRQAILRGIYYQADEVGCDHCGKWFGMSILQDDGKTISCGCGEKEKMSVLF